MTLASAPARWEWLQSAYRIFQTIGIEDCYLMTPAEIKKVCPIINTDGVIGGLWADREGYVDTTGTVHAYAKAARLRGAEVIEHNRVLELSRKNDLWQVVTEKGTISAEHVVNAAGLWAKQVGRMVGLELPVSPLQHHYLLTETIPEIAAMGSKEIPMMIDLEGFTYMRQDLKGVLVGIYEVDYAHWMMDGAPWDYGIELLQEDIDRISNELGHIYKRYPVLAEVGIRKWVNGAFTFSPDGNPLVGPIHGIPNYWLACGVMAGFLQGGGVGKTLAEWMIHGETEADAYSMDIARYGSFASNKEYIRQTTGQFYSRRFVMTYPNEQLWAGRPLKMAPAHDAMTEAGCRWGCVLGSRGAALLRAEGFHGDADPQALQCPRHRLRGMPYRAQRRRPPRYLGLLALRGDGPQRGKLARPADGGQAAEGRGALGSRRCWARLRQAQGRPHALQLGRRHLVDHGILLSAPMAHALVPRSFERRRDRARHLRCDVGFSLSGPKARELLARVTHADVSATRPSPSWPAGRWMSASSARMSAGSRSCGELGYEINCPAAAHVLLRRTLSRPGEESGPAGVSATMRC